LERETGERRTGHVDDWRRNAKVICALGRVVSISRYLGSLAPKRTSCSVVRCKTVRLFRFSLRGSVARSCLFRFWRRDNRLYPFVMIGALLGTRNMLVGAQRHVSQCVRECSLGLFAGCVSYVQAPHMYSWQRRWSILLCSSSLIYTEVKHDAA
jgi:hypothetical protein